MDFFGTGGVGQVSSYNPTQTGSSDPFSNGGEGGLGGVTLQMLCNLIL